MLWIKLASFFLFLAVALGAFGAHALKARLSEAALNAFEIGVRYHFYHGLALLFLALWPRAAGGPAYAAGWFFTVGIIIFSGSLYVLALTGIRWLGMVTPLGGLSFLLGWISLFWAGFQAR